MHTQSRRLFRLGMHIEQVYKDKTYFWFFSSENYITQYGKLTSFYFTLRDFLSGLNAKTIFMCAFNQKSGLQNLGSKVGGELKHITNIGVYLKVF